MFIGIDWTQWLPAITAALIALTVLVGIRGLYQDHTKDGKLTRAGWGVVAAMVVLGILTFLSGLLDQRIAAEKERAEAAEREERFQYQMNLLSELQTGMRESLDRQERLVGVADRNLNASEALQQQTRENTTSVLRRVFAESNRVSAERIAIRVESHCDPDPRWGRPSVNVAMLLISGGGRGDIRLLTQQHENLEGGIVFHGFMGDLGPYETFPPWRNARIAILLLARDPEVPPLDMDESDRMTGEQRRRRGARPPPQICPAAVALLLNGRQVLSASSELRQDLVGAYRAEFVNLRVDPNRLPRFR